MADHLRAMDQIPQMIANRHKAVKASFMCGVLADIVDPGNKKRLAAFKENEFEGCCRMLLATDVSQTPLKQVHAFISALFDEAAQLQDGERRNDVDAESSKPAQTATPAQSTAPTIAAAPPCPKCGSEMLLRTAKRGDRAGKQFYGCSAYPKCRGIVNLD